MFNGYQYVLTFQNVCLYSTHSKQTDQNRTVLKGFPKDQTYQVWSKLGKADVQSMKTPFWVDPITSFYMDSYINDDTSPSLMVLFFLSRLCSFFFKVYIARDIWCIVCFPLPECPHNFHHHHHHHHCHHHHEVGGN